MINLSESIKRTLERIGQTIESDAKNGVIYPLYSKKKSEFFNSTEEYLVAFKKFKWSLESGTNELMHCRAIEGKQNMIKIVDAIWDFYKPFTTTQIANIENDVFFEDDLKARLKRFLQANPTDLDANVLKYFFNYPWDYSWSQVDDCCKVREFKLLKSKQKYNKVLKEEGVQVLEPRTEGKNKIWIAFLRISEDEILKEKGLQNDYKEFVDKYAYSLNELERQSYRLWFDIREKGIYYIYIPDVII